MAYTRQQQERVLAEIRASCQRQREAWQAVRDQMERLFPNAYEVDRWPGIRSICARGRS